MKKIVVFVFVMLIAITSFAQEEKAEEGKVAPGLSVWDTIRAGGVLMIFIAIASIIALGITIERVKNMKTQKIAPQGLVDEVSEFIKQEKYEEAKQKCEGNPCPVSDILKAAIDRRIDGKDATVGAVEDAGAKTMAGLQQRIEYLSVIAVISPMMGLLGTVLGMMQSFAVIAFQGLGKTTLLAEGISKALVTTAFGLIVAIPTMVSYHYLRVKVQNIMSVIEEIGEKFIGFIFSAPEEKEEKQEKETQILTDET